MSDENEKFAFDDADDEFEEIKVENYDKKPGDSDERE